MNKNLSKRIITSFILSTLLLLCLFFHKYTWLSLIIIASIICLFEFNKLVNKIWKKKKFPKNLIKLISFSYLLLFIYSSNELYNEGTSLALFILLVCIFSDIGGYVVGKTVGGKKLTKISPNKTISGSIGSFLFSIIPIFLYNFYDGNEYPIITLVVLLSLQISLICQMGDLLISYFKRKAKVKDTGSILPGHGGILDRIDGIVFGLPFGLLLLLIR
jgi:phosphatidate cytidylyltransferase|tara:strand:- start:107 stop:757 length:651 start_codon:yes stop_codon:yes gene_type:complete